MILNSNLTSQNGLRLPNNPQRLLSVQHDKEQTQRRFSKNLAGKFFIIGDGTDVYVTFINCKATKDHCNYTTKYHKNVLSVTIYEDQTCLNHLQKHCQIIYWHLFPKLCKRMEPIRSINTKFSNDFWVQIATCASCQAKEKTYFGVHDIEEC